MKKEDLINLFNELRQKDKDEQRKKLINTLADPRSAVCLKNFSIENFYQLFRGKNDEEIAQRWEDIHRAMEILIADDIQFSKEIDEEKKKDQEFFKVEKFLHDIGVLSDIDFYGDEPRCHLNDKYTPEMVQLFIKTCQEAIEDINAQSCDAMISSLKNIYDEYRGTKLGIEIAKTIGLLYYKKTQLQEDYEKEQQKNETREEKTLEQYFDYLFNKSEFYKEEEEDDNEDNEEDYENLPPLLRILVIKGGKIC